MTFVPAYVLLPFVTTPAYTAEPARKPDPYWDRHARTLRLISIVRALIIFGKTLAVTLRSSPHTETARDIGRRFGTFDFALIVARITRALRLAAALEVRLADRAAKPQPACPAAPAAAPRKPPGRPAPPTGQAGPQPQDSADSILANLPTVEELAEQLRRRPVHAVLAEIASNLGLRVSDPLWQRVAHAVLENNGSGLRLMKDIWKRNANAITLLARPSVRVIRPEAPRQILNSPFASVATVATGPP